MMAEIDVLQPGLFSTIQDMGRPGFGKFGVPVSGAMDLYAANLANVILHNSPNDALLEITQLGPKLRFPHPIGLAITGGDLSPLLNGKAIENNRQHLIQEDDILSFAGRRTGCRSYIAISGGFKTEKQLGSRSWYEGITGSVRLRKGMQLKYEPLQFTTSRTFSAIRVQDSYIDDREIFCFPGPEYELLKKHEQEELLNKEFAVSNKNNRMAIQLEENFPNSLQPIITGPVIPGTVQLTAGGNIIVLMRDCQTTGGYPRILQLTEAGVNSLAQKIAGESVKFNLQRYNL